MSFFNSVSSVEAAPLPAAPPAPSFVFVWPFLEADLLAFFSIFGRFRTPKKLQISRDTNQNLFNLFCLSTNSLSSNRRPPDNSITVPWYSHSRMARCNCFRSIPSRYFLDPPRIPSPLTSSRSVCKSFS